MSDSQTQSSAKSASTATFLTALVLNGAVAAIEIFAFTVLRPRFRAIYEPRTYVPDENKRIAPLTKSMIGWPAALMRLDYQDIKRTNGMDAYFFVRFLRLMLWIFVPLWLFSWALFLPLHAVGVTNHKTGLDRFTFGNVAPTQQARYAAHVIFLYLMAGWIFWNIRKEMKHFITTRQRHLVDPEHSSTAQANTVLVTGVPRKFLDEQILAQLFSHLPGGAKAIWLNRDLKDMPDVYDRQTKACNKLEGAENDLIKTCVKLHAKQHEGAEGSYKADPNVSLSEQLVPRKDRPMHRLPPFGLPFGLPFIGQKVDTIDWAREEIRETTKLLEEKRGQLRKDIDTPGVSEDETYPPLNSAFVLFNQQIAAHLAATSLTHNEPYRMAEKYTEVAPEDVIWSNLGLNPYEKKVRVAISYGFTAALIILWAIPVAIVGIVANVRGLCVQYHWLSWLCKLPSVVVGLLQGILPAVLLAVLMMLLPIILRLLANFEGIPRRTGLELSLMTRYFIFLVIHGFLIVTISGGIIQALPAIAKNPSSVATLLAQNLPQASTFFLTYILLQGLTGVGGGMLQIVPLVLYYVKLMLLGSTPRSIYKIKYVLRNVAWGTLFPSVTLLTVIALVYTPLQPIVCGLAVATFFFFYHLWTYMFLYVLDQPESTDTGGLFFPKAITHIFVGLYVQQVCLAALFFLSRNENNKPSAIPEGALTIILIVITAGFHYIIDSSYGPLLHSLPLTLAHKSYGMPKEPSLPSDEPGDDMAQENAEADAEEATEGKTAGKPLPAISGPAPLGSHPAPASSPTRATNRTSQPVSPVKTTQAQAPATAQTVQPDKRYENAKALEANGEEGEEGDNVEPIEGDARVAPTDFNHPATFQPQRPIWIPRDHLGVADQEVKELQADHIDVSTEHATMNEKGKVAIDGRPPNDMI